MEWNADETPVAARENTDDQEIMYVNHTSVPDQLLNKVVGFNRRIRVIPVENMSMIYVIYNMVRSNFVQCWDACERTDAVRNKISTCVSATAVRCIAEYYGTSAGRVYFDEIRVLSCNDRLFARR